MWYHGSPNNFDTFKLTKIPNSKLGTGKSIYLTKSYEVACAYAKQKGTDGYVYEVDLIDHPTNRYHKMDVLGDNLELNNQIECVEIFDVDLVSIKNTTLVFK